MSNIMKYLNDIIKASLGKDVRQSIHDAIQQCYYDGKAGAVDLEARQLIETKADKTDVSTPYNFKGSVAYAELPAEGNVVNDTYYCTDVKCKYTWNGSEWYQSSMSESDYQEELNNLSNANADLKSDLGKLENEFTSLPNTVTSWSINKNIEPSLARFNYDTENNVVTILSNSILTFIHNKKTITIDFSNVTVSVVGNGDYKHVFFGENCLYFVSNASDYEGYLYLGLLAHNTSHILKSTLCIPCLIDNTYYYYPTKQGREESSLHFVFNEKNMPTIDFKNRKLIIPNFSKCFAITKNKYIDLGISSEELFEVPFSENVGFQYLVGGLNGIKFVGDNEFSTVASQMDKDGFLYFGYAVENLQTFNFNFNCGKVLSLSILGDSISTYRDYIPSGNINYYNPEKCDVNETWWKRTMNRLGLVLNTNNSWAGSRVSDTSSSENCGVARATLLDNGTYPDIIIIYMGINDFNNEVPLGDYVGKSDIPTDYSTFKSAYGAMLRNVLYKYRGLTKVYCCTLTPCQQNLTDKNSKPECNNAGVYLSEYNEAIREIARAFNVEIIDLESCGITNCNAAYTMLDYGQQGTGSFLHPNAEGHRMIANRVIKVLKDSFLG